MFCLVAIKNVSNFLKIVKSFVLLLIFFLFFAYYFGMCVYVCHICCYVFVSQVMLARVFISNHVSLTQ